MRRRWGAWDRRPGGRGLGGNRQDPGGANHLNMQVEPLESASHCQPSRSHCFVDKDELSNSRRPPSCSRRHNHTY
ncbi:uncharacterized protein CCOS01_06946 [Colletotrichum costaricense]|uniref:Uncharacterized protein n=2 Tax=Colletotrichum acutatum species complex TaxID=2707335 RepID=A0AAI9YZ17_9PEZI|nr:uncharacterized protein CCOS01_06946 [Colletotrichum costaricense]XP_060388068.1 uncharacterized protein CTAM01_01565 [Colletotrichum tamarilloi]KAK1510992.1 hypothetical protein CTAM01_01565 [Colletotrichum tamarilloi]KAK1529112.1 hypothetical protein CCOS01_06946 [Colletotrichum costaricense]